MLTQGFGQLVVQGEVDVGAGAMAAHGPGAVEQHLLHGRLDGEQSQQAGRDLRRQAGDRGELRRDGLSDPAPPRRWLAAEWSARGAARGNRAGSGAHLLAHLLVGGVVVRVVGEIAVSHRGQPALAIADQPDPEGQSQGAS
jgi:hypothetical protein